MAKWPGFVGPSYTAQSKIAADDRTVNLIPSKIESGTGEANYVFDPAPGYTFFCETGTSIGRGAFTLNGTTWAIFGSNLFRLPLFSGGDAVLLAQGLHNPDNAPAQMVGNGDAGGQLLIMSGSVKYYFSLTDPTVPPGTPLFLSPPSAGMLMASAGFRLASAMVTGYYGYAVTYVTSVGETTPSPIIANYSGGNNLGDPHASIELTLIPTGLPGTVVSRKVYRTGAQSTQVAAATAQLKLLTTIADNTTQTYLDLLADASLGANVPLTNTADISDSPNVALVGLNQLPYTATQIAFLNGYGLALDANRSEVRLSGLEDFSQWDEEDVFQRSDAADKWLAMIVVHKEIWLLGSQTSSVYYNSDDPDNPFIPNPSVSIARGIIAPNSLKLLNGSPIWLADDLTVRYANGYTPQRISTFAVEYALSQYPTVLDAEGEVYTEQGHQIYVLNLPSANASWGYDLTTGFWHERGPDNGLDFDVMDVRAFINTQNINLVLSRTGSAVYEMSQSSAVETDGVTGLTRLRRAPHVSIERKGVVIDTFELYLEVGLGLATGQGSNPQIAMRQSKDGGQTWSNSRTQDAGRVGEYNTRPLWRSLGWGRDRLIEVRMSDPIPWRLVDAFMDVRVGAS